MSDEQASRAGSMFGPYHLKRLLGRGGMGEVYEAEHTVKEWTVAVKLLSESFSRDPVFRERMKREARTAGRLQEPHVVPVHDYGEIDGQIFLEMRLVEGTDLDSVLKRFGPLTPPRAVAVITQIASALDAAHAAGVMHRDVKPQNILVTADDFAYLVDFGIASATTDEKLTQLGTAVGTWKYMAPERFSDAEVTYRADIYALACVLFECLTGAPPYRADSAGMLVSAHMMDPIPAPSQRRPDIPKAFDAVIARGMAKRPEDRYASAGDLALAAKQALSHPDQDRAATILRRSQEAALPTAVNPDPRLSTAPPPRPYQPAFNTPPPSPAGAPYYQGASANWGAPPPQFANAAPWGQPPPRPRRNVWLVVAAVAGVFVLLGSGLGIWLVTRPDPEPPTPAPLEADRLSALLLGPSDINTVMGSSTMQPGKPITSTDHSSVTVSTPDCQGALYTTQDPVYAGTGYTSVSGLVSSEPGDNYDHWVNQAVVLFPSADKAKSFLENSAEKWKGCAGKTVTVTNKSKTYRWTFAQVQGSPPKITLMDTQEGADGWECQRALTVANNVIVDINACGYHISDQGAQIADKIAARIADE
ncbi:sensor domain-containing protein [Mycobacterium intracellulare]|uniref:non-specific serine/threonine protein kinase n=1 Tax=Mycobacterium intracellulare TaxID=1767 RepID=A0AAE4UBZ7_MYCIT|nr:serine/threonine-protein kinase PknH/PknJ [Mycobacterium intracellulare]MCA2322372.1 sensor domain-containing protein [Mycobacterium intracellulare]MCA2342906.1 sensor domain-containing protein [Mycobacterium intracellulare]MDV6978419.1 sensor domain-containing protein [Mycobacterium intracellulare]MDV6985440.1 sensor domain-containing protein [Mycobacterium intracellulare]MDV7015701.1 sensor domain-containing protein [Mycobacterium intracellulare]